MSTSSEKLNCSLEDANIQEENMDEEEEMLQDEKKNLQCNLPKNIYLLNLRNWPIFNLLNLDFMPQIRTVMAYCWENRAIIVTDEKIVYTFGYEDNDSETNDTFFYPKKIEELCGKNIMTFAHSSSSVLILTEEGELYSSPFKIRESNKLVALMPTRVTAFINIRIVSIACGLDHYLALTSHGKVYVWGGNNCGQIGNKTITYCHDSKPWEKKGMLENKNVVQIACGLWFNMVLTDEEELYGWGDNQSGQITIHEPNTCHEQHHINPLHMRIGIILDKIVKVACGDSHVLVLTDKEKVYAWGGNKYGQVGTNEGQDISQPAMVNVPSTVVDIAAYADTNVAVGSNKIIYVWGDCFGRKIFTPFPTQFSKIHNVFAYNRNKVMHKPVTVSAYEYEYVKEVSNIMESLKALFDDPSTSDFTIQVEGRPIYVLKTVLQIRSQYFKKYFKLQRDWVEINKSTPNSSAVYTVPDKYSYIVYKAFLKYLYTGIVEVSSENALELLQLANEYSETNLKSDCGHIIKQSITPLNVAFFYDKAIKYNVKELEEFCFQFALRHMKTVILSEAYSKLDLSIRDNFIRKAAKENVFKM